MRISYLLIYLFLSPVILLSQEKAGWRLVKQQKGIDVFVKSIPESPLNAVKATKVVNCSIASAVAVILDVENHSKWMYQNKKAVSLKQINDTSWYYYAQTKVPWPAQNRDYVSKIVMQRGDHSIIITGKGIPDFIPENENCVRLPYSLSKWIMTPLEDNKTFIDLYLSVDVGGTVPPWIINLFIAYGPYQTLLNFSVMVNDEKYSHASLSKFFPEQ